MNIRISTLLVLATSLIIPNAFGGISDTQAYRNIDRIQRNADALIDFEGPLSCNLGNRNDGQSCVLSLMDRNSGKVYSIRENSQIMRLYMNGTKQVKVQGRLNASNQIEATRVTEL